MSSSKDYSFSSIPDISDGVHEVREASSSNPFPSLSISGFDAVNSGDCLDNNDTCHESCIFDRSKPIGDETIEIIESDMPEGYCHDNDIS